MLYGSGRDIARSGRAPGFEALLDDVWRERGFGDFWGYALVAEGAAEAMVEVGLKSWDAAAPSIIIEEAGGLATDLDGRRAIDSGTFLASNGALHDDHPGPTRGAMREDLEMQELMASRPAENDAARERAAPLTGRTGIDDPRALQILSTEHWSLLTARSLAYNESFSRAGMFLTFLSATLIVIGFLIGTQGLSTAIIPVVAILLLADLYIGGATVGRLFEANREELLAIRGMNRIRHGYLEMVPGLEPYFVTSPYDDAAGILATYGEPAGSGSLLRNVVHGLTTAIGMVGTIEAMLFGALVGLVAVGLGAGAEIATLAAVGSFVLGVAMFAISGMRWAMSEDLAATHASRRRRRAERPASGPWIHAAGAREGTPREDDADGQEADPERRSSRVSRDDRPR